MAEKVTIQNIDLLTRAITLLKSRNIEIGEGKIVPFKNILEQLVEVGLNIQARIRLQFQYPDDIGFVLYLTDFTKLEKQTSFEAKMTFRNSIAAALRHHEAVPYMFPETVLVVEEANTWGLYLCLLPYKMPLIPEEFHPQDLSDVKELINKLIC